MRTNARSLPAAAAALFLAASAAAVSGCGKPEAAPAPPGLCRQAKIVIVTYDAAKATMSLSDKTIQLSIKNGDFVQWVSPDGLVYVDKWTPESPFDSPPQHEKKVLKSGHPKKQGKFDYEAKLVLFSDGTEHTIDPRIEILE